MFWNFTREGTSSFLIESCLLFLLLFSPLVHGGLTIFPLSIIEAVSFLTLFLFLIGQISKSKICLIKIPICWIFLFLFLVIFQLVSLPDGLLSFISPHAASIYKDFGINAANGFSLSIYPEATLNYLLQFLSYLAIFFVVLNHIDTEKKIRRIVVAIIICGFLYSMYGIIMRELVKSTSAFSTLTNRNHFAAYLEIAVFLSLAYSLTKMPKTNRVIFIFITAVMILTIFLTASRAGRICFSLSLFIFSLLLIIKRSVKKMLSVILIALLFFSFFITAIGLGQIMQRMETLLNPFKAYSYRYDILKDSLRIIKDFPYLGTGFGTFAEIAQKYKTSSWQVAYGFSHNEPVQLMVETGIMGFLFIFLFSLLYLRQIYSLWLKRNSTLPVYVTLGCLIGILSIIFHSLFDFIFHIPTTAILFFIVLALAYRVVYIKEPQNLLSIPKWEIGLPVFFKAPLIIVLCLCLVFSWSLIIKRYQAEALFEKNKEKKFSQFDVEAVLEYKKVLKEIDRTISLNPMNSLYYNRKADILAELSLREDLEDKLSSIKEEFNSPEEVLSIAERYYKEAIDRNPTKADYHLRLGWLYGSKDETELMKDEFKKASLLDPQNTKLQTYIQTPILKK